MNLPVAAGDLEHYFRLMGAQGAVRVYFGALQCGLWDALGDVPRTPADLARDLGLHETPVRLLLEALAALGAVRRATGGYARAPMAALLQGPYRELGALYWDHLPVLLNEGAPLLAMESPEVAQREYVTAAASLGWMMQPAAATLAQVLSGDQPPAAILDVGAGSAVWSLAFARYNPQVAITAVDFAPVLEVARGAAQRAAFAGRLTLLPGDCRRLDYPARAFDLCLVANLAHLMAEAELTALFARLRSALRPSGRLVVVDILSGDPRGELQRALYALGLALRTRNGTVHAAAVLAGLAKDAGFTETSRLDLDVAPFALGALVAR